MGSLCKGWRVCILFNYETKWKFLVSTFFLLVCRALEHALFYVPCSLIDRASSPKWCTTHTRVSDTNILRTRGKAINFKCFIHQLYTGERAISETTITCTSKKSTKNVSNFNIIFIFFLLNTSITNRHSISNHKWQAIVHGIFCKFLQNSFFCYVGSYPTCSIHW